MSTDEKAIWSKVIFPFASATLGLLMAGNVFFIKRLVEQLDATRDIVWQLRQDVTVLKLTIDTLPRNPKH